MTEQSNFNALIARHEMGQAYKAITAKMGPSAQLIAFLNFDRVTSDSIGLESFNIMDQHLETLALIDGDPALVMATESFVGRLKSLGEKIKKFLTGDSRNVDLGRYRTGELAPKKSNIYVETNAEFSKILALHAKAVPLLAWIISQLPKGVTTKDWEDFAAKHVHSMGGTHFAQTHESILKIRADFDKARKMKTVEFPKSGWNEANFQAGVNKYINEARGAKESIAFAGKVIYAMTEVIDDEELPEETQSVAEERDDTKDENGREKVVRKSVTTKTKRTDNVLSLKAMHAAVDALSDATMLCEDLQDSMKDDLWHVSNHFEIAQKAEKK